MRIGVISNSDSFVHTAYALASQQQQVHIFFSASDDAAANARAEHFAAQSGLPFHHDKKNGRDLYDWLGLTKPDICFVIGYPSLINLKRIAKTTIMLNVHFGPIPAFRGPSPVFWQLKKGVPKLGLCIHRMSEKFDSGEVVWFREIDNLPHYTFQSVNDVFSQLCVEGIFQCVALTLQQMPFPAVSIPPAAPAYHKRPGLEDVLINWQTMGAIEICDLVRACNPWNKGAITVLNQQEIKFLDAVVDETPISESLVPGAIIEIGHNLKIATRDAKSIRVNTVFAYNSYIPGYAVKLWGIKDGETFQNLTNKA